jgi:dihydrofolate reductase
LVGSGRGAAPVPQPAGAGDWRAFLLAKYGLSEEVTKLKGQPGRDLAVGGAGLAASFIKLGLVDEYQLFISAVILGGGTPYFPTLHKRVNLELIESHTFGSRVVYVRYRDVLAG